jgi:hypothetical protein
MNDLLTLETPLSKKLGIVPSVEEYNYHYGGSGEELDHRPEIFKTNEATLKTVMDVSWPGSSHVKY